MGKSKLYRICTENINRSDIKHIVNIAFSGYTLLDGEGCWEGAGEDSLIIEIVASEYDLELIRATGKAIKIANNQQTVLLQIFDIKSELL